MSKLGLTGARRWAQTVLLHCGITIWLKCKCIVTATRPSRLLKGQCMTSKSKTAGEVLIQEQTHISVKKTQCPMTFVLISPQETPG